MVDNRLTPHIEADPSAPKGFERVLYVDDEVLIARIGMRALTRLGYVVSAFTNSIEALDAFLLNPFGYDVVVTDQVMPYLTGGELVKEILRIRNDIPIVLTTGYSEVMDQRNALSIGISEYLPKPFVIKDLAQALRNAITIEKVTNIVA